MENAPCLPCFITPTISNSIRNKREQPPREPENIDRDIEWEVEKIVKSEVIAYTRKIHEHTKRMGDLRHFVKCKGCSEDENTWEPPEGLDNAQELVEEFHKENMEMPGRAEVE